MCLYTHQKRLSLPTKVEVNCSNVKMGQSEHFPEKNGRSCCIAKAEGRSSVSRSLCVLEQEAVIWIISVPDIFILKTLTNCRLTISAPDWENSDNHNFGRNWLSTCWRPVRLLSVGFRLHAKLFTCRIKSLTMQNVLLTTFTRAALCVNMCVTCSSGSDKSIVSPWEL